MKPFNSHTHCQVTQADTQAKTWQRVCLFPRSKDGQSTRNTEGQHPTAVLQKWRCSASYDSFVVGSSSVLRLKFSGKNRHLRKAAKRWQKCYHKYPKATKGKINYPISGTFHIFDKT